MLKRILWFSAGAMLCANLAFADTGARKDLQVFNDIASSVNRYAHFTIFDDVNANVKDGVVTLTGRVTMPSGIGPCCASDPRARPARETSRAAGRRRGRSGTDRACTSRRRRGRGRRRGGRDDGGEQRQGECELCHMPSSPV